MGYIKRLVRVGWLVGYTNSSQMNGDTILIVKDGSGVEKFSSLNPMVCRQDV